MPLYYINFEDHLDLPRILSHYEHPERYLLPVGLTQSTYNMYFKFLSYIHIFLINMGSSA